MHWRPSLLEVPCHKLTRDLLLPSCSLDQCSTGLPKVARREHSRSHQFHHGSASLATLTNLLMCSLGGLVDCYGSVTIAFYGHRRARIYARFVSHVYLIHSYNREKANGAVGVGEGYREPSVSRYIHKPTFHFHFANDMDKL